MNHHYILACLAQGRPVAQFRLPPGEILLGRSSECKIRVPHFSISRRHALVAVADDVVVTDLQSRNGTYVNDEPVETQVVRPGETVRFGSVNFQLVMGDLFAKELDDEISTYNATGNGEKMTRDEADRLLSSAQQRVFDLLIQGMSEREIAERLHLSIHTVHTHVREIYRIFGVHSKAELILIFSEQF